MNENLRMGHVLIARSIYESDIWLKPAWWFKVWVYIIGRVNFEKDRFFDRGEGLFRYDDIFSDCNLRSEGISVESLGNCSKWLKRTGRITARKTTRGIVIKVLNYDLYQVPSNYRNRTGNRSSNRQETAGKPPEDRTIVESIKSTKALNTIPPTPLKGDELVSVFDESTAEFSLSSLLYQKILNNSPQFKKPDLQKWSAEFDKIIRIDERSIEEIEALILWATQDNFWKSNILSPKKFREKYDQLLIRAHADARKKPSYSIIS